MVEASRANRSSAVAFRRGLMLYGSTAAIAASLMLADGGIGPAMAQDIGPRISPSEAAQGNFVPSGGGTPAPFFQQRGATLDIVEIPRDVVLNWSTYDNAAPGGANGNSYVNFLPQGTELRFVGTGQDFTVVNRVFTAQDNSGAYRGIAFQGAVTSYLFNDGQNFNGPVAGNVWFFSPGGILATGTASFNVGSLLLSTSNLGNFIENGEFRTIDFTGVADPFSSVILQSGARVSLTQPGSSFAIVAPTIDMGGDAYVNGSVLYLSAVDGTLSFSNDGTITPTVNSFAVNGNRISHTGTTSGPASIGDDFGSAFDPQTIEFRTARDVDTLLGGTIGYEGASDASLGPNGSIVLSGGNVVSQGSLALTSNTGIDAERVDLRAGAGETIQMGFDANGAYSLGAVGPDVALTAAAGGTIDIDGDVTLGSTSVRNLVEVAAEAAAGMLPGGQIAIGGNLTLDASVGKGRVGPQIAGDASVTVGSGASIGVGGGLVLDADAYATQDDAGVTYAKGGSASVVLEGEGGSLTVGGALSVSARGRPFITCDCFYPGSGSADGGIATVTAMAGTISAGSLTADAGAQAFGSYFTDSGASTYGRGGTATVSLGDAVAAIDSIVVRANGSGANGSTGIAGGEGFGGTASFSKGSGGSLTTGGILAAASATGGRGGDTNGDGSFAEAGGYAEGGRATIELDQNAAGLNSLFLSATALGGAGGSAVEANAEDGADGGGAMGGTAALVLSGSGNSVSGVVEGNLDVSGTGGAGSSGESDFFNGLQSGSGGDGGAGTGGNLTVTAADGATFAWDLGIGLIGRGGVGGAGGDGFFSNSGASAFGLGGTGGNAMGGSIAIIADGGLIAGNLDLDVRGFGGAGGRNGNSASGTPNGSAAFGMADGGSIELAALDNGASRFDVGFATLLATGDTAGTVSIRDESTDPGASMHFGSFSASAYGNVSNGTTFDLFAGNNAIAVAGGTEIYADAMELSFAGTGRLDSGGIISLGTNFGAALINHSGNPGVDTLHSGSAFDAYIAGDYVASAGTRVSAASYTIVRARGAIDAADTTGSSFLYLEALGDATVGNARSNGNVEIYAGRDDNDGFVSFYPGYRAKVTGTVAAGGSVFVESGGFAEFTPGSSVLSDNDIVVRTGDDIVVAAGASLVSDINPGTGASSYLLSGDINVGSGNGDLVGPITTPIASLIVAGSVNTNGHTLTMTGDAIDATGSTINTGNLVADVTDAPFIPPYSNDGGILTPGCFQGSACLGTVTATGTVAIGQASNNGLISLRTGSFDFSGTNFDVTTYEGLDLGADGSPGTLAATNRIMLRSYNGAIGLHDLAVSAPTLQLFAGTDLLASTSTLSSADSILVSVGNDLRAGTIDTGGVLYDGSDAIGYYVSGSFVVDNLIYRSGADIDVTAGAKITVGFANASGASINLNANTDLYLGTTAANTAAITLTGASVGLDTLLGTGPIAISAGPVGIFGNTATSSGSSIAFDSQGGIAVGTLNAATSLDLTGVDVNATQLIAGSGLSVAADGTGQITSFSAGADADFVGSALSLGTGTAGGNLSADTETGDIAFTSLQATGNAYLDAAATLSGGSVAAGGTLSLFGSSILVNAASGDAGLSASASSGTTFTSLSSSAGAVSLDGGTTINGGNIDAATSVSLTGGSATLAGIVAGNGVTISVDSLDMGNVSAGTDISADVFGNASVGNVIAGGDIVSYVAGNLAANDLTASGLLALSVGGDATLRFATSGLDMTLGAGSLTAQSLDAGGALSVSAGGGATTDTFSSGTDADFSAGSLAFGTGSVGGDLSARTTAGTLGFTALNVTGDAVLQSAGALAGGNVAADGFLTLSGTSLTLGAAQGASGIAATTPGNATFTSLASSGGTVSLDAGGAVTGTSANAAGGIDLAGSSVNLGSASFGGGLTLLARSGAITGTGLYSGTGQVTLTAAQGIGIGSVDTLGGVTLDAGAEARFVELRSRDGSVAVNASGSIFGSTVAATGNDPAGDDNVALVADGDITLDGSVTTLNAFNHAQDDFTAQAGGMLSVARVEAGRDLTLAAGAGSLVVTDPAAGRDISLTAPELQISGVSAARNLVATATVGDLTGDDVQAGGNASLAAAGTLDADGVVAGGSLSLDGGTLALGSASGAAGLTATSDGDATFGSLASSAGAVSLTAGGAADGGDITASTSAALSAGAVTLGTMTAGTDLSLDASSLQASNLIADGAAGIGVIGNAQIGVGQAGTDLSLSAASLIATTLTAGNNLAVQAATTVTNFSSGGGSTFTGNAMSLGTGMVGGALSATSNTTLAFTGLTVGGNADLDASGALAGGNVTAGGLLTIDAARMTIGTGSGAAGVSAVLGTDATFTNLASSAGAVNLTAGGTITGGTIAAAGDVVIGGGSLGLATATAGNDILLNLGTLTRGTFNATRDVRATVSGAASFQQATAGRDIVFSAQSLTADGLTAGGLVDVSVANAIDLGALTSGGDAMLRGQSARVTTADVGGDFDATGFAGLVDIHLIGAGDATVSTAGPLVGDYIADGFLSLGANSMALETAQGAQGVRLTAGGGIDADIVQSALGSVTIDAGFGAVTGDTVDAAGDIAISGGDIALTDVAAGGALTIDGDSLLANTLGAGADIGISLIDAASVATMSAGGNIDVDGGSGQFGTIATDGTLHIQTLGMVDLDSFTTGGDATVHASSLRIGTGVAGGDISAFADAEDFTFGTLTAAWNVGLGAQTVLSGDTATAAGGHLILSTTDLVLGSGSGSEFVWTMAVDGGIFGSLTSDAGSITLTSWGLVSGGDLDAATSIMVTGAGNSILGSVRAGTSIDISAGSFAADSLDAGGAISIETDDTTRFGSATAGAGITIDASSIDGGSAHAGGGLVGLADGSVRFGTVDAVGDLRLEGGSVDVDAAHTGGVLVALGDGSVRLGNASAVGDLTADGGSLDIGTASAGGALFLLGDGSVRVGTGMATGGMTVRAGTLDAETLDAGTLLDVSVGGLGDIAGFTAGGDATLAGDALVLGQGTVTGNLAAMTRVGDLGFTSLTATGRVDLTAAQALLGGNAQAGGNLTLNGARIAIGTGMGAAGVSARTPGAASFTALSSRDGAIAVDAGGAVAGGSASAAGAVSVAGASVALDNASFGGGLTLTARTTDLTGAGLYQGTGNTTLSAARGIAIGSVDTLGEIAMTAGTEARFVELRSRDGSVGVDAGSDISGSSAAALGSDPAGDDSVRLVAGGAIALDGASTALNPRSYAQDDFTARAGTTLTIVGVEAGRDLSLTAGSGMLDAANLVAGRDLALTAQAVDLDSSTIAGNLTVRATAGDITGSGLTTAGGAIDLGASGNIAVGSLAANGGSITGNAGGSFGFADLTAAGDVRVSASLGITGSGDIFATNGVFLSTVNGATTLRDIRAGGMIDLSGGGTLALRDVAQTGAGSLTIAYDGDIVLRDVRGAGGASILSGASVGFDSVARDGSIAINAGAAVTGGTLATGGAASVEAAGPITLTGLQAADAHLASSGGAVNASGIAVGGLLDASGTALTLAAPGQLTVAARASAGDVGITSGGDLRVDATATGAIALASTGGSVIIGNVGQSGSTGTGIGAEAVDGGAGVSVNAANAIQVLDSVAAGGALTMDAGGLVDLVGAARGQTIALTAGDLAIGANGALGSAGTQRISLASTNAVNLGTGASGGFAVDASEFGRILSGGDLLVSALAGTGNGAGSITLGSLTVNAGSGGQVGANGTFGLTSAGLLDVNNTLSIARAGSGNTLMLTGDAVDLDYANAALSVLDSASASTGRIIVNGRLITSLSAAAAADIVGKTPDEISIRLGQADIVRDIGLFRTSNLTLQGVDRILIQNSGGTTVDARRGLSVGALTVTGAQDGHTLVIINGVIGQSTGNQAAQNVTLTNPLAAGSSFNGCGLANAAACLVVAPPPAPAIVAPTSIVNGTSDFIRDDEDKDSEVEDGVADGKPEAPPIDTTKIDDPAGQPMIDDPVTGAGNEDLWQPQDPQ